MKEPILITESIIKYKVEVFELSDSIPEKEQSEFMDWLHSRPLVCGTGKFSEEYASTDHDIIVTGVIKVI